MGYNRLKEVRKLHNLNQKDIANYLNIGQSTYSYWEQGTYDIDNRSLQKLADYFNVSIDYLLGRSDVPNPIYDANGDAAPVHNLAKPLNADLSRLCNIYDSLSPKNQSRLLAYAEGLADAK